MRNNNLDGAENTNGANEVPNQNGNSASSFLASAATACASGDAVLGMHLYLAAYEQASHEPQGVDSSALAGLRRAWNLACELKERSMAEYIFEKLEPYLNSTEIEECAEQLQQLALDKLEQFGLSRDELESMADMISQDFFEGETPFIQVEHIDVPYQSKPNADQSENASNIEEDAELIQAIEDGVFDSATAIIAHSDNAALFPDEAQNDESAGIANNNEDASNEKPLAHAVDGHSDTSPSQEKPSQPAPIVRLAMKATAAHKETADSTTTDTQSTSSTIHSGDNSRTANETKSDKGSRNINNETKTTHNAQTHSKSGAPHSSNASNKTANDSNITKKTANNITSTNKTNTHNASSDPAQGRSSKTKKESSKTKKESSPTKDGQLPSFPVEGSSVDLHARMTYKDLVGYDETISLMRDFGIGMQNDPQFQNLVHLLNRNHGLDRMPAVDTLLFHSLVREDSIRFVRATLGEIGLPTIRMFMDENIQGAPVLCVMASSDAKKRPRMNSLREGFEEPSVLVIEDIDLWTAPFFPDSEGPAGLMLSALSRGAHEAINFIRAAVENPDVYVLVSAANLEDIDPFFLDLLEPLSVIDIKRPTKSERADIWDEIVRNHPSLRGIDRQSLVQLSDGMPRYDIYMAAREAVEEAYKTSLITRRYTPIAPQNIFDKLAAYQPLDSPQYAALEDEVIRDFQNDLDHLDDLIESLEDDPSDSEELQSSHQEPQDPHQGPQDPFTK